MAHTTAHSAAAQLRDCGTMTPGADPGDCSTPLIHTSYGDGYGDGDGDGDGNGNGYGYGYGDGYGNGYGDGYGDGDG